MADEENQLPLPATETVVESEVTPPPDIVSTPESTDIEITLPEVPTTAAEVPPTPPPPTPAIIPTPKPSAGAHMRAVVSNKKHERLEKIMGFVKQKGSIVNNDVEMLLKVSDATATRYLSELVQNDRLKRVGIRAGARYESLGSNSAI